MIGVLLSGNLSDGTSGFLGMNRRGRKVLCRVTCSPLFGPEAAVGGAIIVMDEVADGRTAEGSST